jgi:DeoR family transcriptional regulator of aga operon
LLTIITNAVNIAAELSATTLDVILTGGTLRKNSFSLVGPIAEEAFRHLNADPLFLGVDGFDVYYGLTTPNLLESQVNRVMVEIARRKDCSMRFEQIRTAQSVGDRSGLGHA